jgi:hypothetical protein
MREALGYARDAVMARLRAPMNDPAAPPSHSSQVNCDISRVQDTVLPRHADYRRRK